MKDGGPSKYFPGRRYVIDGNTCRLDPPESAEEYFAAENRLAKEILRSRA